MAKPRRNEASVQATKSWGKYRIGWGSLTIYHPGQPHDIIQVRFKDTHAFSKECVDLYQKGVSLNEIARIVGRSKSKVRRVLHSHGHWTGVKISEGVYASWRKTGRTRAQPHFGYTYYMGQLVEEPREQQILALIRRLAAEGMNITSIANYLNAHGMRPRRAKRWHRNSILKILNRFIESK